MKYIFYLLFLAVSVAPACKKSSEAIENLSSGDLKQILRYQIIATLPSPDDSAKNVFGDSVFVQRLSKTTDPDFLSNLPYLNANANDIIPSFSIGYKTDNAASYPVFVFSGGAFPGVPRHFEINKLYERNINENSGYFLGRADRSDGWKYFVDNTPASDADTSIVESYVSVKFSNQGWRLLRNLDTAMIADGTIKGYFIERRSSKEPNKYVHRLDFSVDFAGMIIDK